MAIGAYSVSVDPQNKRRILFRTVEGAPSPIPKEQSDLVPQIEAACDVIEILFPEKFKDASGAFDYYYTCLLSLAQMGLCGGDVQPEEAAKALQTLKQHIVLKESGGVKNRYIRRLGYWAFPLSLIPFVLGLSLDARGLFMEAAHYLYVWTGCMIGVWLSFGARKVELSFDDLAMVEKDQLDPPIRLLFTGFLTLTLTLIFLTGMVTVKIGGLSSSEIGADAHVALLIGILCGFSEKVLASKVATQAEAFLKFEKDK